MTDNTLSSSPSLVGTVDWDSLAPWEVFGSDVILTLHHVLTEPVCPVARISFELPDRAGTEIISSGTGNTVEEAISLAVKRAVDVLPRMAATRRAELRSVES